MKDTEKIQINGFITPVISIVIISFVIGWEFLIIGIAPYVFMLPITLLLLFGFNKLFKSIKLNIVTRLMLVVFAGYIGGSLMYVLLFSRQVAQGYFSNQLLFQYSLMGLLVSIVAFLLYSFGPLRVQTK